MFTTGQKFNFPSSPATLLRQVLRPLCRPRQAGAPLPPRTRARPSPPHPSEGREENSRTPAYLILCYFMNETLRDMQDCVWEAGHRVGVPPGANLSLRGQPGDVSDICACHDCGAPDIEWGPGMPLSPPTVPGTPPHGERPGPDALGTKRGAVRQGCLRARAHEDEWLCLGPCPCTSQRGLSWKGLKIDHLFFTFLFLFFFEVSAAPERNRCRRPPRAVIETGHAALGFRRPLRAARGNPLAGAALTGLPASASRTPAPGTHASPPAWGFGGLQIRAGTLATSTPLPQPPPPCFLACPQSSGGGGPTLSQLQGDTPGRFFFSK